MRMSGAFIGRSWRRAVADIAGQRGARMVQAAQGLPAVAPRKAQTSCATRPPPRRNAQPARRSNGGNPTTTGVTMKRIIGVAAAALCAASFASYADTAERAEHKADKAQAEADYKAAKANCKTMAGGDKRACNKEDKAH